MRARATSRRLEAQKILPERDPEVAESFLRLVIERERERPTELLVELMDRVHVALSRDDATVLIVCTEQETAWTRLPWRV